MESNNVGTQTEESQLRKKNVEMKSEYQQTDRKKKEKEETMYIQSCDFEIFGIVNGVSFRTYTLRRAQKLGVRGWCMRSEQKTIKGLIQGYPKSFEAMRLWLMYTGSPTSRIDKCVFGPIYILNKFSYSSFRILTDVLLDNK